MAGKGTTNNNIEDEERQRLMSLFGSFPAAAVAAAATTNKQSSKRDSSSGSSNHLNFSSPSPPTSANASSMSSGQLPENIHLSMPTIHQQPKKSSKHNLSQPEMLSVKTDYRIPKEPGVKLNQRQERKIKTAYHNHYAHLVGNTQIPGSGKSPAYSVGTENSSFTSPKTITLEEIQRASRHQRRQKWSEASTPNEKLDRDSGLFGNQPISLSNSPTFEAIQEEEEPKRPKRFEVHVPPPESLARTQTLATRSPTPTRQLERPPSASSSGRPRRNTVAEDEHSPLSRPASRSRTSSGKMRSKSMSSTTSSEKAVIQQLSEEFNVPLIPPPPEGSLQFFNPFMAGTASASEKVPSYIKGDQDDGESMTRTRIRRNKPRVRTHSKLSSIDPKSPSSMAYSLNNSSIYASSNMSYELTHLGMHRTDAVPPPMPTGVLRGSSRVSSLRDEFESKSQDGSEVGREKVNEWQQQQLQKNKTPAAVGKVEALSVQTTSTDSQKENNQLVPLTPAPQAPSTRKSKSSAHSSQLPPSLFGSDKSVFTTPLLSKLPQVAVPSDIASLRTSSSSSMKDSVLDAVGSPVSIGGRKKQSLVVDSRRASQEMLQNVQEVEVKAKSPELVHSRTASSSIESPPMRVPTATSMEERRQWATKPATERMPLTASSGSSSADSWGTKLRTHAATHKLPQMEPTPQMTKQSKTSGGISPPRQHKQVYRPDDGYRRDRVNSALATLEGDKPLVHPSPVPATGSPSNGKRRHNRDPSLLSPNSPPKEPKQPAVPAVPAVPVVETVESVPALVRPPTSQMMGRHGSSPLNPQPSDLGPFAATGSGNLAPPPVAPNLLKRITGSLSRRGGVHKQDARTPLPKRWWRNIKESINAPIPLMEKPGHLVRHSTISAEDMPPNQPLRRHSFSGSTDIEHDKMAANLSPHEHMNYRLANRVKDILLPSKAAKPLPRPPTSQSNQTMQLHLAQTLDSPQLPDSREWSQLNPFLSGQQRLRRRKSFDTLNVHEMAEADRLDMESRLSKILSQPMANSLNNGKPLPKTPERKKQGVFMFPQKPKPSRESQMDIQQIESPIFRPSTRASQRQEMQEKPKPKPVELPPSASTDSPIAQPKKQTFLQKLTAGWQKPSTILEEPEDEGHHHHHNKAEMASGALAAAGLLGRLFRKPTATAAAAAAAAAAEEEAEEAAPMGNNVLRQSEDQMHPQHVPEIFTPSDQQSPQIHGPQQHSQQYGSQQHQQQPVGMPTGLPADVHPPQQIHVPSQQPPVGPHHSQQYGPYNSQPPTAYHSPAAMPQTDPHRPSKQSKLTSALASVPLVSKLFNRPPPMQRPSRFDNQPVLTPNQSYYTSNMTGPHGLDPQYQYHQKPPSGGLMDKLKGMLSVYQIPLLAMALRRGYLKQRIPLVGRYATRYPITETMQKPREAVKLGADPAMDDKRFRMGHRGMNFDTLDHRLEHSVVPQFSKVRKYRRAPEVWDDEEAQRIADRVRRPGGGGLRGGGNVLSQGWKPVERVEGHGGSGETGMSKVGLMDRLQRRSHSRIEEEEGENEDEDEDEEELVSIHREPSIKETKRGWFSRRKKPEEEVIEVKEVEVVRPPPQPIPEDSQPTKTRHPPMFAPFSHLPQRVVDHLLHRVGEPQVFVGSASSQLVMPDNDPLSQTSLPYRTGSEWNFTESVQFSTPYPTTQQKLRELPKVWRQKSAKRLLVKPKDFGISRWPQHLEIVRDYLQLIGVVLGACGFIKAPLGSSVGDRWPWIVLVGVPDAVGLLWADLSTTTGQSYGFLVFFGLLAVAGLVVWMFSVYLEAPSSRAQNGEKVTYEEELTEHSRMLINPLSRLTRRQRLNIVYFVLAWLYVPVTKLALETIVWGRGYWAVDDPYRTTDHPADLQSFCYKSTMRKDGFNFAYLVIPLACVLLLFLGLVLPVQVHYLVDRHMPNIPGWRDGKTAGGFKPAAAVSAAQSRSTTDQPRSMADQPRSAYNRPRRDDINPMLSQDPLQGLLNPELLTYAHALYNTFYGATQPGGGMASGAWQIFQKLFSRTANSSYISIDLPADMPEDQRYQARIRAMKEHHRNKHLATVQYRQALDQDRSDLRFLYKDHYPVHASDPARWMLWRLVLVVFSVVLQKDNCWARKHSRESLDIGRNVMLVLIILLMLRSHHAHRPYFDPTANLSGLLMRLGLLGAAALAFPLDLISNPLSSAHTGISVLAMVANFCMLSLLVWLALSSLPQVSVSVLSIQPSRLSLSPGILTAKSPYDPRLRRLLIERVWQDTWSAILLGSRDFRLLPNHRVDFTQTRTHPPYMTNYIGFASERHLENLHLYDNIGRQMYCQAVELERHNDRRLELMDQVARLYCGPDQYFNPYATVPLPGHSLEDPNPSVGLKMKFGVGRDELKSWFGRVEVLHFPFTLCITYDELPDKRVLVVEERDIRMFIEQNTDPKIQERRTVRHKLRCLHGRWVTLTYVENMGADGTHHRYCLPEDPQQNQAYLAQFRGRRRIIYRGKVTVGQQEEDSARWNQMCNVSAGFACRLEVTDQCVVEDTGDLDSLDRSQPGCLRRVFWETGQAKGFPSATSMGLTEQSRRQLRVGGDNRHLLGVTWGFDQTETLRALFDENQDLLDLHLDEVQTNHRLYQQDLHRGFIRKRIGLSPSFHTDVFAPGPESYHLQQGKSKSYASTPTLNNHQANGAWQNDKYGRLSCIPTLEQLQERLETVEENPYMRQLLVDHRDDIILLYERLRTLVPSQSNDPVKFGWYIFWDDLYRRYAGQVKELKEFEVDFCPLYPQSLAYYPLPRHRLERFLYERKLWVPIKKERAPRPDPLGRLPPGEEVKLPWLYRVMPFLYKKPQRLDEIGMQEIGETEYLPFTPGTGAHGFLHSGHLNRLYCWLDALAHNT